MANKAKRAKIELADNIIALMQKYGGDSSTNQQKEIIVMSVADLYQQYLKSQLIQDKKVRITVTENEVVIRDILINWLCSDGYSRKVATKDISEAEISFDGGKITIIYLNGATDVVEISAIQIK